MVLVKDAFGKERAPARSNPAPAKPAATTPAYKPASSNAINYEQRAEQRAARASSSGASAGSSYAGGNSYAGGGNSGASANDVYTPPMNNAYTPPSSNAINYEQQNEQIALMNERFKQQQAEAAENLRVRLQQERENQAAEAAQSWRKPIETESGYRINPADEQRAEQIVLQSARKRNGVLTAAQIQENLWPALQERLKQVRHYDGSFFPVFKDFVPKFSDSDREYFSSVSDLQNQMHELQKMRAEAADGVRDFGSKKRTQSFLDFMDEKITESDKQYRQQLTDYINAARISIYAKQQLSGLANELSYSQLERLNTYIQREGVTNVTDAWKWERMMRDLLSNRNDALALVADDKPSIIGPHYNVDSLDSPDSKGITVSGYYYSDRQYWVDVKYNKELSHISLGKTIPRDMTIYVNKATDWDMAGEQLSLCLKMFLKPQFVVDGIYGTAANMNYVDFLPDGILPSDIPIIGKMLESMDKIDLTAHITKETIFFIAFVDQNNWNRNMIVQKKFNMFR